jgi:outer membrane biosynthesis protein TonB
MPRRSINGLASALLIGFMLLAGCSSGQAEQPAVRPVAFAAVPPATPTPLATESQVAASNEPSVAPKATPKATPKPTPKPTPKATPKPKPKATPKPASYYKPPGWDGSSDVDCTDFDTHAQAQSFFKGTGGSTSNDPYGLDRDHDGLACETLP